MSSHLAKPEWGEKRIVTARDGIRLIVRSAGTPNNPTMICLPRHGGNGLEFARFAHRHQDRFRVISIDIRGHGEADFLPKDRGYSVQGFTNDVVDVVDALEVVDAVGVGVSVGGSILGMLQIARPKALRAAVVVDSGAETPPPKSVEEAMKRMQKLIGLLTGRYNSREAIVTAWREVQSDQWPNIESTDFEFSASCIVNEESDGMWTFSSDVEGFMMRPPGEAPPEHYWPGWKALSNSVPTMLVHGLLSNVLTSEIAERMVQETSVAYVAVPGIGHWPTIDAEPVRSEIDSFVRAHAGSPAER